MKIALNKTYLTKEGEFFSPIRSKMGKQKPIVNMLGNPTGSYKRGEMIFIDAQGVEKKRSELVREVKIWTTRKIRVVGFSILNCQDLFDSWVKNNLNRY